MNAPVRMKAADRPRSVAPGDVRLGKDILELLSTAMYLDPMVIWREYVQNAADAIDQARRMGVLGPDEEGRVDVTINARDRTIRIRDNGAALEPQDFGRRMVALGGSDKRGTAARGFRGVGRLSGLAYAQELVFRSRAGSQGDVCEARWDCRSLRGSLAGETFVGDVADLVSQVATVTRRPATEGEPARFFEVELARVARGRSDRLLDPDAVADYLAQVAPVPFSEDFRFGAMIAERLRPAVNLAELALRINEGPPLRRPHRDHVDVGNKASAFEDVTFVEVPGQDGGLAAVGWVLHHGYEGALGVGTLVKGLRLRVGNLQVGDHTPLEDIFPEVRFNSWSVGEVHVLDRRIVPNGRRDHFEGNAHFANLLNHLGPCARDIARRCRTNSTRRSKLRQFELGEEEVRCRIKVLRQGSLGKSAHRASLAAAEATLLRMEKLAEVDLFSDAESSELVGRLARVRSELSSVGDEAEGGNPLRRLPAGERAFFERMFELIYDCSTNRTAAKALVDRVLDRALAMERKPGQGGPARPPRPGSAG